MLFHTQGVNCFRLLPDFGSGRTSAILHLPLQIPEPQNYCLVFLLSLAPLQDLQQIAMSSNEKGYVIVY